MPSGLSIVSFLQGSSSCILKSCPSHLSLPIFITLTVSSKVAAIHQTIRHYIQADRKSRKCVFFVFMSSSGSLRRTGFGDRNVCVVRDIYLLVHSEDMLEWPRVLFVLFSDSDTPNIHTNKS